LYGEDKELVVQHITPQMAVDALNQLDTRFDAHDVEKRLLRLHTVAVAQEILRYANSGDVLRNFSAQLARWIDRTFQGQIRQVASVHSENLGGRVSSNTEWEKLVPQVTVPAAEA
jgi:hypothetical protein